jgi:ceramide glucosyltransferase
MSPEIVLAIWTAAGLTWWIVALRLTAKASHRLAVEAEDAPRLSLSIFKPLPPLSSQGLRCFAAGLESFMAQLDPDSEVLLGVHEADRDLTGPFLKQLRIDHPHARLKVIFRAQPDGAANPKIAWQRFLAPHAEGELWLWSDADIVVPEGFLRSVRLEFARSNAKMMTFPYVVEKIPAPPALLEALFVNVEFYPGVLLLRERGPVDFGLGAGMIFRRDDFLAEVGWDDIGDQLADDFFLGQMLKPVAVGRATAATLSSAQTWSDALAHDFRWAKTIRWNRPVGSFARIAILPVAGWLAAVALQPLDYFHWMGLLGMIQADVLFAALICRQAGCRLGGENLLGMELWSIWRVMLWILSWLPWPVTWSGRKWWRTQVPHILKSA